MFSRRGLLGAAGAGAALAHTAGAWAAASEHIPPFEPVVADRLDNLAATLNPRDAPIGSPSGVSLTLAKDGRAIGFWSQGFASQPFRAPVTPRTLFHTGSNGKHVTALGVLQMVEAGKVSLDDPIGRHVKSLPGAWAQRRLRDLLHHTSGIPDYAEVLTDWDRPQPRKAVIKAVGGAPMVFGPGETWSYSNTNYLLLGWLLEDVSGLSYVDYVRTRLFGPAGLPDARSDAAQEVIADRAEPYETKDGRFRHAVQMENGVSAAADGGLLFSARDVAPWGAALSGKGLVSAASMAATVQPIRLKTGRDAPYGMGWFLDRTFNKEVHRHTGAVPGFISAFVRLPAEGLMAVAMSNGEVSSAVLTDMAMVAMGTQFWSGSWMSTLPGEGTDARSRKLYAIRRRNAAADPNLFAEEIRIRLKGPGGDDVLPRSDKLLSVSPVEEYAVPGGRMIRYRIVEDLRTFHHLVGWTDDDRIFWI
jgi:CubicO group peptidase (beta-lactamase class C family)